MFPLNYGILSQGGFLPSDIPGLKLWVDVSNIATLWQDAAMSVPVTSNNDVIGAVEDISGSGNHATQTVTASKPLYKTGGSADFDGVDDFLQGTSFLSDYPAWVFTVNSRRAGIATHFSDFVISATNRYFLTRGGTNIATLIARGSEGNFSSNASGSNTLITHVAIGAFNTTTSRVPYYNLDIGALSTNLVTWPSTDGFLIGLQRTTTPTGFFNGLINEQLVYDSALTEQNRIDVTNYLMDKWSITP